MRTISQLGTIFVIASAIVTSSALGTPKLSPSRMVFCHRRQHLRMRVAGDHRAP